MKNANHFFGSHNGSENFYRHNFSGLIYTDGVKDWLKDARRIG